MSGGAVVGRVAGVFRYAVKGLNGAPLEQARLLPARGIRHDRRYGLFHGKTHAELCAAEKWRPWNYCRTLKKTAELTRVTADIAGDDNAPTLALTAAGGDSARGRPHIAKERAALEAFLRLHLGDGDIRLQDGDERPLWDEDGIALSLLNAASARALAQGENVAPLAAARFRANIVFDGVPAWAEEGFGEGGSATIGNARLALAGGIPRCAATTVNPQTAARDAAVPQMLLRARGHNELGVFAHVAAAGDIAAGMEIRFEPAA